MESVRIKYRNSHYRRQLGNISPTRYQEEKKRMLSHVLQQLQVHRPNSWKRIGRQTEICTVWMKSYFGENSCELIHLNFNCLILGNPQKKSRPAWRG